MENGRKKIHVLEGVNGWPKLNKNGERINQMNVYELCVIDVCWYIWQWIGMYLVTLFSCKYMFM